MKALLVTLAAFSLNSSWAALGGAPASFGPRMLAAQSHIASTGMAVYTESEKKLDSGTIVREYLDANGTVFAVSWSGPFPPDLKEVLGSHFETMVAEGRGPRAGRPGVALRRSDLVIVSGGHMGAFQGQAWLPQKLPAGFNTNNIK